LLDTKTFSTNESRNILGLEQWNWFENIMNNSNANVVIIASEMPLNDEKLDSWQKNEQAYRKLISLVESSKSKNFIILTRSEKHKFEKFENSYKPIAWISPGQLSYDNILKDTLDIDTENPAFFGLLNIDFNPKSSNATYYLKGAGNISLDSLKIELLR